MAENKTKENKKIRNIIALVICLIIAFAMWGYVMSVDSPDHENVFDGVTVESGAEVVDSVLLSGACVKAGAKVHKAILAENSVIGEKAQVGFGTDDKYQSKYCSGGVSLIGPNVQIDKGEVIAENSMVVQGGNE